MIPVVTVHGMRQIDLESIQGDIGIGYRYMRTAGKAVADAVRGLQASPKDGDIAIVCGKGNNGGDGFVAGRLLMEQGYGVMCFALCDCSELTGEARRAFDEYSDNNGNFLTLSDVADCNGFAGFALLVDALLGTGIRGAPHGLSAELIRAMNESAKPIVAVDTPSGLNNDTGEVAGECITATLTVTMGFPKLGSLTAPGSSKVGQLRIADLGYPEGIVQNHEMGVFLHSREEFREMLPERVPYGSKFEHGLAMIVGGSAGMTGSTVLACEAALRSGCGMVHCVTPGSAVPTLSSHLVETVFHPVEETPSGTASAKAMNEIVKLSRKMNAACIGPGFSHALSTSKLVRELVAHLDLPLILDADGINAFKGRPGDLKRKKSPCIITPHRGEWQRVFGALPDNPHDTIATIREKAQEYELTILLKGHPSFVVTPDGKCMIMPYGNSALASAGSGDVLSGVIVSLLAQGCLPETAAVLGAFIQGFAGEISSERNTPYVSIATDVIDAFPEVFHYLTNHKFERKMAQ